jgi:hypothetical protein
VRVLPWALGGAAVVIGADMAADLALRDEYRLLDVSSDSGLDASLSLAAVALAAIALALAALRRPRGRARLAVAGAGLAFIAFDMATGLHERLSDAAAPAAVDHWPAAILYAPILAAVAVALWLEGSVLARAAVACLGAAVAIRLVAGAVYLAVDYRPGDGAKEVAVAAQQALELAGWLLLAAAAIEILVRSRRPGFSTVVEKSAVRLPISSKI